MSAKGEQNSDYPPEMDGASTARPSRSRTINGEPMPTKVRRRKYRSTGWWWAPLDRLGRNQANFQTTSFTIGATLDWSFKAAKPGLRGIL